MNEINRRAPAFAITPASFRSSRPGIRTTSAVGSRYFRRREAPRSAARAAPGSPFGSATARRWWRAAGRGGRPAPPPSDTYHPFPGERAVGSGAADMRGAAGQELVLDRVQPGLLEAAKLGAPAPPCRSAHRPAASLSPTHPCRRKRTCRPRAGREAERTMDARRAADGRSGRRLQTRAPGPRGEPSNGPSVAVGWASVLARPTGVEPVFAT